MTKIHLDTDIGGDMDDLCALAMLLKWPGLEITGVTTVSEEQGRRAGYVHYVLSLVGRTGIPSAAGADVSGEILRCAQDDNRAGIPSAAGTDVSGEILRCAQDDNRAGIPSATRADVSGEICMDYEH